MKRHKLLLLLVIFVTFLGGFCTGVLYSSLDDPKTSGELKAGKNYQSEKSLQFKETPKLELTQKRVLIGYMQDFRDPNSVNYEDLTHLIFSFAHPTKDGDLLFSSDDARNNLRDIVSKASQHDTKVMLALGGWYHVQGGESYDYFKAAISKPASRTKLVGKINQVVEEEKLDGIDIDFEHPRSQEDARNLASFVKELSKSLHDKNKELSIAVNAKVHSVAGTEINNVVYEPTMFENVDHVNIMAYDGQWDGEYNAANLSPYQYNENIVDYWTSLFERCGISKEKLVLGIPLYAQPEDPNTKQVSYNTVIENNPENAERDVVTLNGTTYYYNGEKSVQKKTNLAMDNGLGGMMLWEVGLDTKGQHSLTAFIAEELNN
jgi:GH18 family chitinase